MRSRSPLRLAAVLALQVAILAAIPLRQVRARLDGTVVTLETVPFDPFDVLSGYYATLRYAAESPPGLVEAKLAPGDTAFVVVEHAVPAWRAVGVAREPPPRSASGRVALRAVMTRRGLEIVSAGRFYVPESRRAAVDEALRARRGKALVDLRVDGAGNVALLRLRDGERVLAE
ncbi:GDYXXLXY domain-containing protein [Anaeromyxobacter sp. SG64]|uniref:GDYXXLXY domain-containing protein n=1 Tax=Anaeromyxobacter sp. SG64 TaxID=2925409 RepID=UPI001F5698D0|nr:GDYXXLXY domain-containing protein [Anaeromyxobacter sp. SG64]